MHRFQLLVLSLFASALQVSLAQAPIELRTSPPTPQTQSDRQWDHLQRAVQLGYHDELRIQAVGPPIRCNIDDVTPAELFCTEYRALPGPMDYIRPRRTMRIPRAEVANIRSGGRELSTFAGMDIGAGAGVALGSRGSDQNKLISALLVSAVGGFIGHFAPFKGRVIYRAP